MHQLQDLFIQEWKFHMILVNPLALSSTHDAPQSRLPYRADLLPNFTGHDLSIKRLSASWRAIRSISVRLSTPLAVSLILTAREHIARPYYPSDIVPFSEPSHLGVTISVMYPVQRDQAAHPEPPAVWPSSRSNRRLP
jgi:hypothetical protein